MPWTPVQNINPFVFPFLIWLVIFIRMNRMKTPAISYPSLKRDDDGNSTAEMDDGNVSLPSRAPPGRTATRPRHPIADSGSASARAAEARRRQHYTALDKEQRYFKNRVLFHVGVLGMLLLFLALAYEVFYFYFRCEVSSQYRRALILLSHDVMDILKMESVPHWLDYSSLLAFNRGQLLNEWEYDVDISLIHPGQHPGSQEGRDRGVLHLRNLFHQQGYPTRYDPRVDLVQVFGAEKMSALCFFFSLCVLLLLLLIKSGIAVCVYASSFSPIVTLSHLFFLFLSSAMPYARTGTMTCPACSKIKPLWHVG